METNHIAYVRAIAELESISIAAERFGITQGALSKTILRLEGQLGAELFVRSAHGTRLTPFGHEFLNSGAIIERQLRDLESLASRHVRGVGGTLAIGAGSISLQYVAPEIIRRMHAQHPAVTIRVHGGSFPQLMSNLGTGALDLFLGLLPEATDPEYEAVETLHTTVRVVARQGHPVFNSKGEPTLSDLLKYQWVGPVFSPGNPMAWRILKRFRQEQHEPPRLALESSDHNIIIAMLKTTNMLGVLPDPIVAINAEYVKALNVPRLSAAVQLGLIWRASRPHSPAMQAVIDIARAVSAEMESDGESQQVPWLRQ